MNKIYKVIWSKVKHQYVVVSELAHSNGKQSRTSRNSIRSRIAALVVCGAIAAFGVFNALPNSAYAADSDYIAFVTTEKGQNANENQGNTIQINGYKYTSTRIAKPDNSYTWYWVRDGYNIQLERLERPGSDGSKDYVVRAFKDGGGEVETSLVHSYQNKIEDTGVTTLNGKNLHSYEAGVYAGGSNGYTAVRMEDKWSEADQTFKPNNDPMIFDGKEWRQAERTDFKDVKFNEETGNYEYNGQIVATENLYVVDFVKTKGNDTEVEGTKLGCFVVDGKVYTGTVHGKNNEILMTGITGINEDNKYVTYWASEYTDEKATMAQMPISQYKETISGLASDINAIHQDDIKEIQINQIDNGGSINLQTNGEFVPARDEKGDIITDETGKPVYVAQGGKNIPGGITIRNTTNSGSEGNDVAVEISNDKNSFTVDAGSKVVGKITTKNGVEEAGVGDANKTLTGLKINGVDYALSQGKTYSNGNGISIDEENNKISVNAGDGLTFGTEQTNDKGKLKVNVGDGLSIADGKVVNNLAISGEVTDQNKNGGNWTITDNKTGVKLTNTTLSSTVDKQSMTGNEYGNTYTISDTDGNTATLEDVASATKLSSVDSKIGELNYSSVTSEDNTIKDNDSVTTAIGKLDNKVNTGWTVADGNTENANFAVKPGETLTFNGDDNVTVEAKDHAVNVSLKDNITLGDKITLSGEDGKATIGGVKINNTYNDENGSITSSTIDGLTNKTWDSTENYSTSGKAATEAQLQAATDNISGKVNAGWKATAGETSIEVKPTKDEDGNNVVPTLNFAGDDNISVTADNTSSTIKVTLDPTLDVTSVDAKGTTISSAGLTVGGNTYVSSSGINANSKKITNVADGTIEKNSKDAVNAGQLYDVNQKVDAGWTATDGTNDIKVNPKDGTTTLKFAGDNNIAVTADTTNKAIQVALNDKVYLGGDHTEDSHNIVLDGDRGVIGLGSTIALDGRDGKAVIGSINIETVYDEATGKPSSTISGLANTTWDADLAAQGGYANSNKAATEAQIQSAVNQSGWTASTNKNVEGLAAKTDITNGDTVDFSNTDGNISVSQTAVTENGTVTGTDIKFDLNDNISLGDGKITLNGAPAEGEDLLNVDNKLVVAQDGTTTIAVNDGTVMGNNTTVTIGSDGVTFAGYDKGSTIIDGQTIQAGGVFINDGGNGQITRLTNTTLDDPTFATVGRAATEEQLQLATDAATTTVSEGKNIDVTSTVDEEDGHTDYEVSLQDNVSLGDGKITLNGAPAEGDDLLNVDNAFVVGQDGTTTITADDAGTMGADTKVTVGTDGVKFEGLENGTTTIDGQTIQAGGVFINDGGNGQITRLTNTTLDDPTFATVGRAATEEQLKQAAAASKTTLSDGVNTTVTSNDNTPDGHVDYQVNLNDNVYLGGNNKPGSSNIELDGENGTIQVGSNIILDSKEARAVIGGVDISTTFDDIGKKSSTITGLSNTTWDTDKVVIDRAATEGQLQMVSDKVTAGWTATDDAGNKINVNPETRPTLNFASGKNITVSANEDNGEVEVSLNDVVTLGDGEDAIKIDGTNGTLNIGSTFAVAEDGTVLSDGDVIADADGEKYSLSEVGKYAVRYDKTNDGTSTITLADGDDLSGTRIKNVADGVDPKDAVNVSQLEAVEATANAGWTASDGTNSISIKPNETLNFVGDENLTVSADGTDKKLKVSLNDDITLGNTEAGNTEGERSFTINTTDPNGYVPESYKTGSGANFIEENGGFMLFATDTQGFGVFGVTAKGSAWARDFKTYTTDIYGNNTQYSLNEVGDAVAQMSSYYNGKNSYTVFSRYLNEAEKDNPFVTVDEDGNTINATRDIPLALRDDGAVLIGATIKGEDFTDNGIRINAETKTTYDKNGNEVTNNIATITGLENTEWKPPTPVATFAANDGSATVTSRAATESQLNDLYSAVAAYDVNVDGTIDYSHIALAGTPYGASRSGNGTHTGGTSITNVAYASGNDGSEAVNVDYLNDAINNAVKDGGAISDSDRHLQEGTYHVNDQGKVELIVADEKGENQSTVTIDNIANKNDITNLDNKIDNTFNDLNDKINNIDNVETDVKGGNINEDGTISLKTENEDGTTTNVTLKGQLTDSGVVQEGTSFDKETGTITITSQDKYSGETSSVKVEGIASTEVVGATNKEDLATAYKDADKDGNATTEYITDSESMVEADVALDHAIQDVAGTSYANDMVLSNRIDSVEKRLGNVEERIDKVGAMAAAIANLRTMGFDPEAPTEIAIGVGQYKSETGIAIGVFHYPNQDFMLSASLSSSGDELMGGIGATWKLGRKSAAERAKDEEARHLEQAEEMKKLAQQEKVKAQAQRHAKLLAERQQASQKNA